MIEWSGVIERYEDASHRLRTARRILLESTARLPFVKGDEKKATVEQIKKSRTDITNAKKDISNLAALISRSLQEEIRYD